MADKLNNPNTYSSTEEVEYSIWNGRKLYRKVFEGGKATASYGPIVNTGIDTSNIMMVDFYCVSGSNASQPYYNTDSDKFRACIDNRWLYAETGANGYPVLPATIRAVVYYFK